MPMSAEVRTLDSGYDRETRSLLYHAYRHEPTFAYLFEADRPGYQQRVRATVRELVNQHFLQQQPALGLLLNDRLIAVALIAPPQRRLDITESWAWRARMLLTAGFAARGATDYHAAVLACLPSDAVHLLPLLGVHPQFRGQHYGEQLLEAVHEWCAEDETSWAVIDTGNPRYLNFYQRQGYEEIGQVAVGPVVEHVFFHPAPRRMEAAAGCGRILSGRVSLIGLKSRDVSRCPSPARSPYTPSGPRARACQTARASIARHA